MKWRPTVASNIHKEEEIFLNALESARPTRDAYLDEACGDDAELRRRVEALLRRHQESKGPLDAPLAGVDVTANPPPATEKPGTLIGPYKLLQQIGEGGMGTVFMAEQTEPVQRQGRPQGHQARHGLAPGHRPLRSRAAGAGPDGSSQHRQGASTPARPTAAGPTSSWNWSRASPSPATATSSRLTPKERLELFIPVCQAVQHAHQKGIIHRDIKPSNVLVASYDGKPVPKVIDFGVAKATGQQLTERTLFTGLGAVVGTLEYMSPEQAELNQLDIDTRSDIYSLGVLLYELLTGSTPLEKKRLKAAALLEMLRVIREEEPPKPSTRLSTTDEMPSVAANRGLEPKKLSGLVRGELDWIVMKALEKDRNRRYETANGFALDVQRYLADEPVQACPPSARYRLRKFARKHRTALTTTAAIIVFLLAARGLQHLAGGAGSTGGDCRTGCGTGRRCQAGRGRAAEDPRRGGRKESGGREADRPVGAGLPTEQAARSGRLADPGQRPAASRRTFGGGEGEPDHWRTVGPCRQGTDAGTDRGELPQPAPGPSGDTQNSWPYLSRCGRVRKGDRLPATRRRPGPATPRPRPSQHARQHGTTSPGRIRMPRNWTWPCRSARRH